MSAGLSYGDIGFSLPPPPQMTSPNQVEGSAVRGIGLVVINAVDDLNNPKFAQVSVNDKFPFEDGYLLPMGCGPFAVGGTPNYSFYVNTPIVITVTDDTTTPPTTSSTGGVGGSIAWADLDQRMILSFTGSVSSASPTPYYKAITDHVHNGNLNPDGFLNPDPVNLGNNETIGNLPYMQNTLAIQSVINSLGNVIATEFPGQLQFLSSGPYSGYYTQINPTIRDIIDTKGFVLQPNQWLWQDWNSINPVSGGTSTISRIQYLQTSFGSTNAPIFSFSAEPTTFNTLFFYVVVGNPNTGVTPPSGVNVASNSIGNLIRVFYKYVTSTLEVNSYTFTFDSTDSVTITGLEYTGVSSTTPIHQLSVSPPSPATYDSIVLADSPMQYYRLDNTSTIVPDLSGNASNASVLGTSGTDYHLNVTPGPILDEDGGAYSSLNTTVSHGISAPGVAGAITSSSWSMEAWVYLNQLPPSGEYTSNYTIFGNSGTFRLLVQGTGNLKYSGVAGNLISATTLSAGQWYHIVLVSNITVGTWGNVTLYINGVADANTLVYTNTTTRQGPSAAYYWGQYDLSNYYKLNGKLARAAVYTIALPSSSVVAHYNAASAGTTSYSTASLIPSILSTLPLAIFANETIITPTVTTSGWAAINSSLVGQVEPTAIVEHPITVDTTTAMQAGLSWGSGVLGEASLMLIAPQSGGASGGMGPAFYTNGHTIHMDCTAGSGTLYYDSTAIATLRPTGINDNNVHLYRLGIQYIGSTQFRLVGTVDNIQVLDFTNNYTGAVPTVACGFRTDAGLSIYHRSFDFYGQVNIQQLPTMPPTSSIAYTLSSVFVSADNAGSNSGLTDTTGMNLFTVKFTIASDSSTPPMQAWGRGWSVLTRYHTTASATDPTTYHVGALNTMQFYWTVGSTNIAQSDFLVPGAFYDVAVAPVDIKGNLGPVTVVATNVQASTGLMSTPLNAQGSLLNVAGTPVYTYSSTTTSIQISIPATTYTRTDKSTVSVPSYSQTYSSLTASTTYHFDIYYDSKNNVFGSVSYGTVAPTSAQQLSDCYSDGRIGLYSNYTVTTPSTGTGGGAAGGGGGAGGGNPCPAEWQLIETQELGKIRADELDIGMHIPGPGGWVKITELTRLPAPIWRYTLDNGEKIEFWDVNNTHALKNIYDEWQTVETLKIGDVIKCVRGFAEVVGLKKLKMAHYIAMEVEGHIYYLGDHVVHNPITL